MIKVEKAIWAEFWAEFRKEMLESARKLLGKFEPSEIAKCLNLTEEEVLELEKEQSHYLK